MRVTARFAKYRITESRLRLGELLGDGAGRTLGMKTGGSRFAVIVPTAASGVKFLFLGGPESGVGCVLGAGQPSSVA